MLRIYTTKDIINDNITKRERIMKALIVDDDFTNRVLLQGLISKYAEVHVAVNGSEACDAVQSALDANVPYDLICLDVMMPEMDGHEALNIIREREEKAGINLGQGSKIIMITGRGDSKSIMSSFSQNCDAYLVKPIDKQKLIAELTKLSIIN